MEQQAAQEVTDVPAAALNAEQSEPPPANAPITLPYYFGAPVATGV